MKKILYIAVLVGLFSACNNSKSNTTTETQTAPSGLQTAAPASTENQTGLLTNPEHGKPGHDCALPVGAPLAQKTTTQQVPAPSNIVAPPTNAAPAAPQPVAQQPSGSGKLNPAHGQPGHDCAKPVGAPLS